MLARTARLALALVTCTFIGCGGDSATDPADRLVDAQMRWGMNGSNSYSITVTRSCECPPEEEGSVVVTVENSTVYSRAYTPSGTHVPTYLTPLFPSVWELFDILVEARTEGPAPLSEAYHATYGYPTRVEMPASAPGGAVTYEMSNLVLR